MLGTFNTQKMTLVAFMQQRCVFAIDINVAKTGTLFERHLSTAKFLNKGKA